MIEANGFAHSQVSVTSVVRNLKIIIGVAFFDIYMFTKLASSSKNDAKIR